MTSKLIKNTVYLYLTTAAKIIAPLITLPWLTRVLAVDTYGTVAYVKAFASYAQLLLDFGFLLSATRDVALSASNKSKVGRIVGDTLVEKLLLASIGAVATGIAIVFVPLLTENALFTWLYYLSCAATILILDFLFRGLEKMEYVAIPLCCAKILVVIATILLVKSDRDMILIPVIEIIGNILAGTISLLLFRRLGIRFFVSGLRTWLRNLKVSGVYFLSNFATTFLGALTTLIVGIVMSKSDVAFWSVCMMVVSAAKSMYAPLGNSLYPHMVVHEDLKLIRKTCLMFTVPLIACAGIVMLFGTELMALVGGAPYAAAGETLKMLVPVLLFSFYSMLLGWPALGVVGKAQDVTLTTVGTALLQLAILGGLIATNTMSLATLAIACGISEFVLLASRFVALSLRERERTSNTSD